MRVPRQVVGIRLTQTAGDDARVGLITTSLEIAFSEPVEAEDAADSVSLRPSVDGAVSWSGSTMILTPADAARSSRAPTRFTSSPGSMTSPATP